MNDPINNLTVFEFISELEKLIEHANHFQDIDGTNVVTFITKDDCQVTIYIDKP